MWHAPESDSVARMMQQRCNSTGEINSGTLFAVRYGFATPVMLTPLTTGWNTTASLHLTRSHYFLIYTKKEKESQCPYNALLLPCT